MIDAVLIACEMTPWTGDAGRCLGCNAELTGRRTRWCSLDCSNDTLANHMWTMARFRSMKRTDHRCEQCGAQPVQVHHVVPCLGAHGEYSCKHHQTNLTPLCHEHHLEAHALLRARADHQLSLDAA